MTDKAIEPTMDQITRAAFRWVSSRSLWDQGCDAQYFVRNWRCLPELKRFVEEECAETPTRAFLWTGIGCFVLSAVIVFVFVLMVIDAMPGPRP